MVSYTDRPASNISNFHTSFAIQEGKIKKKIFANKPDFPQIYRDEKNTTKTKNSSKFIVAYSKDTKTSQQQEKL